MLRAALVAALLTGAAPAAAQLYPPYDPNAVSALASSAGTIAGTGAVTAQVQATMATTAADGSFAGNWPQPFASAPTGRLAEIESVSTTSAPYKCSFIAGTVTATSFQGKCWQIVATTFPTTVAAILGLTVSPLQNAAAGMLVRVFGRQ